MKILGVSPLFLGSTTARLAPPDEQGPNGYNGPSLAELGAGRHMYQAYSMLMAVVPEFEGSRGTARDFIIKHGCYCFPGGQSYDPKIVGPRYGYHGPALDELDQLCKDLWRAQTCLNKELECTIDDYTYPFQIIPNPIDPTATPTIECGPGNENQESWSTRPQKACTRNVCELEKEFALRVAGLVSSGYQLTESVSNILDQRYWKYCPTGVYENELPRAGKVRTCCGEGMDRRLFNPFVYECCDDERVRGVGQC